MPWYLIPRDLDIGRSNIITCCNVLAGSERALKGALLLLLQATTGCDVWTDSSDAVLTLQ